MTSTMNDKVEFHELVLLSDEPAPDHEVDDLGLRRYADVDIGGATAAGGAFHGALPAPVHGGPPRYDPQRNLDDVLATTQVSAQPGFSQMRRAG
jgi:hypothetical protein